MLEQVIRDAGFDDVTFSEQRYNTFADAPQESSAANFGTQGVDFTAVKPVRKP